MSDDIAADVTEAVRDVGGHPIVENGARVGYAVNGIVHLLIAWIAIQLALQPSAPRKAEGQETVDQSGALATLASSGLGKVTLLIAVGGFALLALWQVTEAVIRRKTSVRLKSAAKGIVYASLAWSAFAFVRGAGSSSSEQTVDVTAELMNRPLGQALVAILGFVVLGIGGYHVYKGAKCRFLHDLREHPGQWAVFAGRYGYIAKGVALALVAVVFLVAAWHGRADEATGLDGGLESCSTCPWVTSRSCSSPSASPRMPCTPPPARSTPASRRPCSDQPRRGPAGTDGAGSSTRAARSTPR